METPGMPWIRDHQRPLARRLIAPTLLVFFCGVDEIRAGGPTAPIEVIYTEVSTAPTSLVPGARDALGLPAIARFTAITDLSMNHDGTQWVIRGTTDQGVGLNNVLLLGSGLTGSAFAQSGQAAAGGAAGEQYDFFDGPVPAAWNENGVMAYSFRAKNGDAATAEKIATFDGVSHVIVHQQGDPALGLIDNPVGSTGNETFGNTMNSVHLLNDGRIAFVNSPIQMCNSARYPAFFRGNTSFIQCGVTQIEGEEWDNLIVSNCGGSPDGLHWFAEGDTESLDTMTDYVFVVDGEVKLRENTVIPGTSITVTDGFAARMLSDGSWVVRGDDPSNADWAVHNGALIAASGQPIADPPPMPAENWGLNFTMVACNRAGDYLVAGDTTHPDLAVNGVMVLNGTTIVAREGAWIDANLDGLENDNAYIGSFRTAWLTEDLVVYFLAGLKNLQGLSIGDALLRLDVSPPQTCPGDIAPIGPKPGDGDVNVDDLLAVINAWGACPKEPVECPADVAPPETKSEPQGDGTVNVDDLLLVINNWGACG